MTVYYLQYMGKYADIKQSTPLNQIKLGERFVYLKNINLLNAPQGKKYPQSNTVQAILPIIKGELHFQSFSLFPKSIKNYPINPHLSCITTDRMLYREQDTIHIFIASPINDLSACLFIQSTEKTIHKKNIQLKNGVSIQTFANLGAGEYTAKLYTNQEDHKSVAKKIHFTVAEYLLMPLSACFISTTINPKTNALDFEIVLESYQKPFTNQVKITLIENDQEQQSIKCKVNALNHYKGQFILNNKNALTLRITAIKNAQLTTELLIQGAEKAQREGTLINNLGTQQYFSLIAESKALPLLGGYINQREISESPLIVEDISSEIRRLKVLKTVNNLTFIHHDVINKTLKSHFHGHKKAGDFILIKDQSPVLVVYIGGFVGQKPFENYTTFIKKSQLNLSLKAPKKLAPRDILKIDLSCQAQPNKTQKVLLVVRDQRLIAAQPAVALATILKEYLQPISEQLKQHSIETAKQSLIDFYHKVYSSAYIEQYDIEATEQFLRDPSNIAIDEEGYLEDISKWSPLFAEYYANKDGLDLTAEHWEVIKFLRAYFEEYQIAPAVRVLIKAMKLKMGKDKGNSPYLYSLFPYGPAKQACRYAGIPRPTGCISDGYYAGSEPDALEKKPRLSIKFAEQGIELDENEIRKDFPELLYFDLVNVEQQKTIEIPLQDNLTTLSIEAFAINGWDWASQKTSVIIDKPVRIDLEVPLNMAEEDKILGSLLVHSISKTAQVALYCDQNKVPLRNKISKKIIKEKCIKMPARLSFDAKVGDYHAVVIDHDLTDITHQRVNKLRQFKSEGITTRIIYKNQQISLKDHPDYLDLKILPNFTQTFIKLLQVSANYQHLCCEQTAFKILSATYWYLFSPQSIDKSTAKHIIITGTSRLQSLFSATKGFAIYPQKPVIMKWSKITVQHLLQLPSDLTDFDPDLQSTMQTLKTLATKGVKVHQIITIPIKITNMQEAYFMASKGEAQNKAEAKSFIYRQLKCSENKIELKICKNTGSNSLEIRQKIAYIIAALLALNEDQHAILLLQQLLCQSYSNGMFYSTLDTAATIPLFLQLHQKNLINPKAFIKINDKKYTLKQAIHYNEKIIKIETLDSICIVQIKKIFTENWQDESTFPIKVKLFNLKTDKKPNYKQGEQIILQVSLPNGYKVGDFLQVSLPDCLSWLKGGGQIKQFSLDFAYHNELLIPLAVVYTPTHRQHFSLCVQNMFQEERASHSGLIVVQSR